MTLIIGSEGSMGKRYQAILKHLHEPFEKYDPKLHGSKFPDDREFKRFIIASPTDTHAMWVKKLDVYKRPILCEKPLSKDLEEVEDILQCESPITMMMQYYMLADKQSYGPSFYNFYHHGPDGMVWDCFQIIALAKGEVELHETSPIWKCMINGRNIQRGHMDGAYVEFVREWIRGGLPALGRIQLMLWHRKVKEFEEKWTGKASA
jgi:hypothetical protein